MERHECTQTGSIIARHADGSFYVMCGECRENWTTKARWFADAEQQLLDHYRWHHEHEPQLFFLDHVARARQLVERSLGRSA